MDAILNNAIKHCQENERVHFLNEIKLIASRLNSNHNLSRALNKTLNSYYNEFCGRFRSMSDQTVRSSIDFYSNSYNLLSGPMPFNYIYCPKNGCSTIINSLLQPHASKRAGTVFAESNQLLKEPIDLRKETIAIARHPIRRFFSALYDKASSRDKFTRTYYKKLNIALDVSNPDYLLDALIELDIPMLEGHFRPQAHMHCHSSIIPSRTFKMEAFNEINEYLRHHGYAIHSKIHHATSIQKEFYQNLSDSTVNRIYKMYEIDFDTYQYPRDSHAKASQIKQDQYVDPTLIAINNLINDGDSSNPLHLAPSSSLSSAYVIYAISLLTRKVRHFPTNE